MNRFLAAYSLTTDDLERFDAVYLRGPGLPEMIEDSAVFWRNDLRPIFETDEECRWAFLRHICVKDGSLLPLSSAMESMPSVARYICLRTEERVASLDAEGDENPPDENLF